MMTRKPINIAVIGIGEIARNQHFPSIESNPDFELVAGVSRNNKVEGVPNFSTVEEMLERLPEVQAVSLCMPPQARFDAAQKCIKAGKHVFLEKPPGVTISEVDALADLAKAKGVTLFASWHSRYAPAVETAKSWLAQRTIKSLKINWRENVRKWHPGQEWIWQAGGMGVFDPGINALSIFTYIVPQPVYVRSALLTIPENCQTPIAVDIQFGDESGTEMAANFDWREDGDETWEIAITTDQGEALLSGGGAKFDVDGQALIEAPEAEYDRLYERFAELLKTNRSDVDLRPQKLMADVFIVGSRELTEPFFV